MALFRSLRARVVLWVSVALTVLFAVTIAGLDRTFRRSSERAVAELLEAQLLGLIAIAEPDPAGSLTLPAGALNPQLEGADSGLYAALFDAAGRPLWQSLSLIEREFPIETQPRPGEQRRSTVHDAAGFPPLAALASGITWVFDDDRAVSFTFAIAASLEPSLARQAAFRRNLIGWFAGVTVTMVLVVGGLLTFVLLPVRRLERQVREVEAGNRKSLSGSYPAELEALAANLNRLIETEYRRLERYRHTIDDLAHALKTPLAAMRSLISELKPRVEPLGDDVNGVFRSLERELERMEQRVSYQLRRARASGATGIGTEPVAAGPIAADLKETLDKVYRDKRVRCELRIGTGATFRGDAGDLTEVLGNLMDNAYKYCRGRVRVALESHGDRLVVAVADDGAGIDASVAGRLLERGMRADETVPGQGIGLAVVREIVALYAGLLTIESSELGGAEVRAELARAGA